MSSYPKFRRAHVYTLQQVSPYLGGLWEISKDGQPKSRSCKESCVEWLNKWAGGVYVVLPYGYTPSSK